MGFWRDVSQEGGEKIIFTIVIIFLLSLVAIRLLWGGLKIVFGMLDITLPMLDLSGTFVMFILVVAALLVFSFAVGNPMEKGVMGLFILIGAIILLMVVGFYAPDLYPTAFQAAMVDMHSGMQAVIPIP